ncbi:S-antigen protein-like [Penaeus vannamei]|uniref:S-antigen protein-like n=1 Tax=Penaeus vannamei TaxID=6689 RepID=UPI00387F598C
MHIQRQGRGIQRQNAHSTSGERNTASKCTFNVRGEEYSVKMHIQRQGERNTNGSQSEQQTEREPVENRTPGQRGPQRQKPSERNPNDSSERNPNDSSERNPNDSSERNPNDSTGAAAAEGSPQPKCQAPTRPPSPTPRDRAASREDEYSA